MHVLPMMEVENFSKSYQRSGTPAVNNISFKVNDGEILGFAGLNGAGKTTTIKAMAGILLPTSGSIVVNGHMMGTEKVEASREIGWMPEFPNFEPDARPIPLLTYYAGFYGIKGEKAKELARKLLSEVGLDGQEKKKVKTYSQGMKKRFSLASSMISDPSNYLFDESLNGLDPEGINFMRKLMSNLKEKKKAVFLSSHILSELENLADRIIIIHRGSIIETLTRTEMKSLGKPVVRLKVTNADDRTVSILQKFGTVSASGDQFTVTELSSGRETADDINSDLVKNGYKVSQFNVSGQSLEEHFFQLIQEQS